MPVLTPPVASAAEVRAIDTADHVEWCRRLAVHVSNKAKFHYQEREELISVAYLELVRLVRRFDPSRLEYGEPGHLFRGWAKRSILTACRRAVRTLRGGGMSGLGRDGEADESRVVVENLSEQRTPAGDRMEFSFTGLVGLRHGVG